METAEKSNFFDGFDDFEPVAKSAPAREEFPCDRCNGTGTWTPSYGSASPGKCHACNGRGHFLSSSADRFKARKVRADKKTEKIQKAGASLEADNPGLIEALRGMTSWNEFARSLVEQFETRGSLSGKQIAAARRMIAKTIATRAKKKAERENITIAIDLAPIRDAFETAHNNGRSTPTYRGEGLLISRAPDGGKNKGALYVKTIKGEDYQGKIIEISWMPVPQVADETLAALQRIAKDPEAAAIRYGLTSKRCSVCGRELTKQESIDRGIGPICADNWGW